MLFRLNPKRKIQESPLPKISKKTLKKMESIVVVDNPFLNGLKKRKVLFREI